jgi:hypothetical protein
MLLTFLVNCADTPVIILLARRPGGIPATGWAGILTVDIVVLAFIFWWMGSISLVEEAADSPPAPDKPPGTK